MNPEIRPENGQSTHRLVVKSGLHRNASLLLGDGEYTIGRGISNDLVLSDLALEDVSARLIIAGQKITVVPQMDGFLVNEKPAPQNTEIEWRDGNIQLADVSLRLDRPTDRSAREHTEAALPPLPISVSRPRATGYAMAGALASVAICSIPLLQTTNASVMGTTVALRPTAQAASGRIAPPHPDAGDVLRDMIARNEKWRGLSVSREPGGAYALKGIVRSNTDVDTFRKQLHGLHVPVKDFEVLSGEQIAFRAEQFLRDPGLNVRYTMDGVLEVNGDRKYPSSHQRLKLLKKELPAEIVLVDRTTHKKSEKDKRVIAVKMPMTIAAVNATEGYVEADDGARFAVGSTLSNGYVIEKITVRAIHLSSNGQSVIYKLN